MAGDYKSIEVWAQNGETEVVLRHKSPTNGGRDKWLKVSKVSLRRLRDIVEGVTPELLYFTDKVVSVEYSHDAIRQYHWW